MVHDNQCQVDVHQLRPGRPPSLLPFDSLLMPYPVTSAWRRQIAEAHSVRYVEASATLGESGELFVDVNRTGDSEREHQQEFHVRAGEGERVGEVYSDADEATGDIAGKNVRQASLNIGFIGHDFDEHPTAHMIEGVFLWQKRLSEIKHEELGGWEPLDTGEQGSPGERPSNYRVMPTAATACCR